MARELSPAEERAFARYEALGTPEELQKQGQEVEKLKSESAERRQKVKDLEAELAKAKPEGAVVLVGDEAKAHEAWNALGITPEDATKLKTERDELKGWKVKRERSDILSAALETEGWGTAAVAVLQDSTGFDALDLTEGEVTVETTVGGKKENQKRKTAFATVDGKPMRVSEWVKEHKPHLVPLLAAQATNGAAAEAGRSAPDQRGLAGGATVKTEADFKAATAKTAQYDSF